MQTSEILIAGDTPGIEWRLPVLTFEGRDPLAPAVYIQAALHADELPGVAAVHDLVPMLQAAEARGDILGPITIVPKANPIGAAQWLYGEHQGRFELGSRVNFNRDYPLVPLAEKATLTAALEEHPAADRLKRHLLSMALAADLVLDLHCDDESQLYAYFDAEFWPAATDLAESFGLEAVLLSDGNSTAFEEAVTYAWRHADRGGRAAWHEGRISLTMEFRGQRDVDPALARRDAEGILSFLIRRGAVAGSPLRNEPFSGPVAGLDYVQMVNAPVSGAVLFEVPVGAAVKAGDRIATLVPSPGDKSADRLVTAPADGIVVTRISRRFVRRGDNLVKIASHELSGAPRRPGGALED
jgi:predicted deacylase